MDRLESFVDKHRKVLTILGVSVVLGSWVVIPTAAKVFYNVSSLDVGFLLTLFWAGVWGLNVLRKKYL